MSFKNKTFVKRSSPDEAETQEDREHFSTDALNAKTYKLPSKGQQGLHFNQMLRGRLSHLLCRFCKGVTKWGLGCRLT